MRNPFRVKRATGSAFAFRKDLLYEVQVSYVEVYNEEIRDLLSDHPNKKLEIKGNNANIQGNECASTCTLRRERPDRSIKAEITRIHFLVK